MRAVLLALSVMLTAPYQCGTEPNTRPIEDSAPKALWRLSERFQAEGNATARETTLRQLIEQYPSSRYAERARQALGESTTRTAPRSENDPEHGDE